MRAAWKASLRQKSQPGIVVVAIFATLAIIGLDACGGGGDDKQAANEPRRAIRPADNAKAKRIVFALSDFPAGWRADISEDESATSTCVDLDLSGLTVTGRAESKDFAMGDNTEATSNAAIYQSADQAQVAFARIASDKTARCLADYLEKEFKKEKDLKRQNVTVGEISVGRLTFPTLGDRSAAYQVAIPLETQDFSPTAYLDLILVQRSRANALLIFGDLLSPFDENLKRRLSRAVVRRMPTG